MATIFDEALDETASPASVSGDTAPTVFHEAVAPKNTVFHEALAEPKQTVFHEAVKPSIPEFDPSATPPPGVVPISGAASVVVQHVPMPGYDKRVTAAVGDKLPDQPTVNQNLTVAPPVHPPGRTEAQAMEQAGRKVNVNLPGDIRYAGTQVIQTSTGDSRAPTIIGRLDDPQNIKPIIPFSPEQRAEIQQRSQQHIAQHGDIQVARNAQAFEQYLGSMPRVDVNAPEQPQENGQIDTQGKTYQAQQLNRFVQANPPPMHLLEGMPPQQAAEFQNRLHQNLAPVGGLKYTPQEQFGAEAGKLPGRLKAAAATLMDLANIKTNQERRQQQEQQKVADLYGTDLSNQLARANPTVAEKLRESARKTFEKFDGTPADFGGKLIELGSATAPFFIPYIGPLLGGLDIAGQAQIAAEDALKAQNPHGDLNDIHSRALLTAAAKGAWGALTAYVGLGGKGLKGVGAAGATGAAIEAGSEAIGHVGYGEPIDPAKIMEAGATMGLMHAVFHPQETGEGLIEAGKKGIEAIREKLRGKPEEGGQTPSEAETKAAEYQPPLAGEPILERKAREAREQHEANEQNLREAALTEIERAGHRAEIKREDKKLTDEENRLVDRRLDDQATVEENKLVDQRLAQQQEAAKARELNQEEADYRDEDAEAQRRFRDGQIPQIEQPQPERQRNTATEQELRRMPKPKLQQQAEDWGVAFDARSTTIPRILDAQRRSEIEQMSDKELYRAVKDSGQKAGNRQKNIETLLRVEGTAPSYPTVFHEAVAGEKHAVQKLGAGGAVPFDAGQGPNLPESGEGVRRGEQGNAPAAPGGRPQAAAENGGKEAPQGTEAPEASSAGINLEARNADSGSDSIRDQMRDASSRGWDYQTWARNFPKTAAKLGENAPEAWKQATTTKTTTKGSNESATPNGPEARGDNSQTQAGGQEENAVRGQKQETQGPQAAPASDANDAGVLDLRRAPMSELRQYAKDKGIRDIPSTRSGIIAALQNQPVVETPMRPKATDTITSRRQQLTDQLRDMIVNESGQTELSSTHPQAMRVGRGEANVGSLISPESAIAAAEKLPEGHPAKLILHNLRELEKNPRGTKFVKVNTNDVADGTRVVMNDSSEPMTIERQQGEVVDDIRGEIPEGGMDLYGKKVLPPLEKKTAEFKPAEEPQTEHPKTFITPEGDKIQATEQQWKRLVEDRSRATKEAEKFFGPLTFYELQTEAKRRGLRPTGTERYDYLMALVRDEAVRKSPFKEPAEEPQSAAKPNTGIFGQPEYTKNTGEQRPLFHEPKQAEPIARSAEDQRIANKFKAGEAATPNMFEQKATPEKLPPAEHADQAAESAVTDIRHTAEPPKKFSKEWAQQNLDRIERERQEALKKLPPDKRRPRGSSILEPEQLFYQGVIAAHDIVKKAKDFATWSKQMVEKLGEAIRPHLPTLWDHVRPRTPEETATGIKNAQVDLERLQRGLQPAMQAARRGFGQVWDEAMKEVESNPTAQDNLIRELKSKPRALTDREDALLLHKQIQLQNDFHHTAEALVQAHADKDQAGVVENRIKSAALSDQLLDLYNINKSSGTETGRGLNARKMMANEDFSLAAMETKKRAANDGRALTDQERKGIARLHDRIEQTQESLNEHEVAAKEKQGDLEFQHARAEINQEVTRDAADDKQAGRVRDIPAERRRIVASMDEAVKKGALPTDLRSYIRALARNFVASGVTERDALLDAVHGEVHKVVPEMSRRQTMDAISGYGDFKSLSKDEIDVKLRDLKGQMQQVGKLEDMSAGQAPMKTGVERRVPSDEERRLIQQVNETKKRLGIQTADPETQLKSALDSIKTRLGNQIKDLEHQIATGTKIVKDKAATPRDAEALKLEARRDELKKQFEDIFGKSQMSDEQRLKLATDAVQRSISEYERRIKEKDLFPGKKPANVPSGDAYKALLARRDALAEELKHLRDLDVAHQESSKETQLSDAIASLQKRIADGDASTPDRKSTVDSQRIAELKAQKGKLAEQLSQMRKNAAGSGPQDASKQQSLQKSIADLEQRIAAGDIAPRPQKATVDSQQTTELKARRDELQGRLNEMRKAARPKKTPEEIALQATKTRLKSNIADLAEKIAAGDFSKRAPREVKLDDEGLRLKAENERLKDIFHRDLVKDNLKKRTMAEKVQDTFIRWRRGFVLSSPVTIAKLISAAGERMITTPTEEVAGYGFSRIVPGLAERAPREGGLSVRAEAKAITEGFTKGMIDSWRLLKTGKSDLDQVYGKDSGIPQHAIDFLGNIHGALKTVTKRNEFARSFQKRAEWSIRNGLDASDPMVQSRIALDAYKDANRSIFMQDNRVVGAYKMFLAGLDAKSKATGKPTAAGKAAVTVAHTLLPIIKVPTNIVAETMQYAMGSVSGSVRLAAAYARGIENLKPEQADAIMRSLKKGSIGAAAMALGYFAADKIGGYYQPGQKRDREDVKYGAVRAFGHDIPSYLVHNPLLECLQIGATVRRVADSKFKKKDDEPQGIGSGAVAAALGVVDQTPFVREITQIDKILDPQEREKAVEKMVAGIVVPQASQFVAQQTDKDAQGNPIKRTPEGTLENIKMGIPGLRQQVFKEQIGNNTTAEKAVDIYLARGESERKALEPIVLKKVLDASHLKADEQDKLLEQAGIAPPPDLALSRELESLNKRAAKDAKAKEEIGRLLDKADARPDQKEGLTAAARRMNEDRDRLNGRQIKRQRELTKIHQAIAEERKRIEDDPSYQAEGERRIKAMAKLAEER